MVTSGAQPAQPTRATLQDWLVAPADARLEFLDGVLIQKALPDVGHGKVQLFVGHSLLPHFGRPVGGRVPGGWWFASEVDLLLDGRGFRPDLAGWRRERVAVLPTTRPMTVRPDWVCEIISPSNASHDRVTKMAAYHRATIPHYWLLDPSEGTLVVMRYTREGYLNVLGATREQTVRAEPFEAIELRVADLLGDDPVEPPAP